MVIIHGTTGSGKSTQLPQYILDHYIQRSAYCNIVVTQPRKIGASSIARWISKERSWALGGLVGYQVRQTGEADSLSCQFLTLDKLTGGLDFSVENKNETITEQ